MHTNTESFDNFAVIWFDENVLSEENLLYQKKFLAKYYHNYLFNDMDLAINKIRQLPQKKVLVITSGRHGESFIQQISNEKNIIGVIVFTRTLEKHKWIEKYSSSIILASTLSGEVFNQVHKKALECSKQNHQIQNFSVYFCENIDKGFPVQIPQQNVSSYEQSKQLYDDFIEEQTLNKICQSKSNQILLFYLKKSFVDTKEGKTNNADHSKTNLLYKQIIQEAILNNPKTVLVIMNYILSLDIKAHQFQHITNNLKHIKHPQLFVKIFCYLYFRKVVYKKLMVQEPLFSFQVQIIEELAIGLQLLTKNTKYPVNQNKCLKLFCEYKQQFEKEAGHKFVWQAFIPAFKQAESIPKKTLYQLKLHEYKRAALSIQWPAIHNKLGGKAIEQVVIFPGFIFEKKHNFLFNGQQINKIEQIVSSN